MKKAHNPKTTCLDAWQELAIARSYKRILFASIDRMSQHFLNCRRVKFQCENDRNSSAAKGNHDTRLLHTLTRGTCCVMQWMLPPPSRISRA